MMKKRIFLLTLLLTVLSSGAQAFAVSTPAVNSAPQVLNNQSSTLAIQEQAKKITSKFEDRLLQFNQFIGKLEQLRAKQAILGKDVTKLDNAIRLAKVQWSKTNGALADFKRVISSVNYNKNIPAIKTQILSQVSILRTEFSSLYRSVAEALSVAKQINNNSK
jgi:peptidoglycan hydrolase CwlO-like protein